MKTIASALACTLLCGCAYLTSKTVEKPSTYGGVTKETRVRVYTLFDSQSALAKFRNTTGITGTNGWTYPSGTTIGTLDQSSSSTNLNVLIESVVNGAVQGALKAVK